MSYQFVNIPGATQLPFEAYNEYESQFKEVFCELVDLKKELDNYAYDIENVNLDDLFSDSYSISLSEEGTDSELSGIEYDSEYVQSQTESQFSQMSQEQLSQLSQTLSQELSQTESQSQSQIESQELNQGPSVEPLPELESNHESEDESNPNVRVQLLIETLKLLSNIREDIYEFLRYIYEVYNIDLTEPQNDLPFEVIDEILTYIDYDPDTEEKDNELNLNQLATMYNEEPNTLKRQDIPKFQNLLNKFIFNLKTIKHLIKLNAFTNDRIDPYYHKFQNILKPLVIETVKIWKYDAKDFQKLLHNSIEHYSDNDLFDKEYSDHDW